MQELNSWHAHCVVSIAQTTNHRSDDTLYKTINDNTARVPGRLLTELIHQRAAAGSSVTVH